MKKSYWFFGSRLTIHADAGQTGGRYDLIEGWFPPGMQTPLHRHTRYQEQLFVLEGEFTVWIAKSKSVLTVGQSAIVPIGAAHCIAATGNTPARGIVIASPSGFAHVVSNSATPGTFTASSVEEKPPAEQGNMDAFERLSKEVGDEILGPPGMLPG
ncbi:MAG: cupin domain-containing protein [Chthoniobacterales bacterium]